MTWPSLSASGTRGYMVDRIDDELKRSNTITTRVVQCINDAITIYQAHRFHFSEGYDGNFSTVLAQEYYSSSDNAAIKTNFLIDYLAIVIGTARFDLGRRQPEEIDLLTQSGTQRGQPQCFSYFQEKIRVYPVPDGVYSVIMGGHQLIAAPANDAEANNRWMVDAERLIRSRAKYELSLNYNIDFPTLAETMHPETGAAADAFSELKRMTAKRTATGRVRPTQF